MDIRLLPDNDQTNGWSRILPARKPRPALASDVVADWLVIGGGYAGLAAARQLAERRPNQRIALIEAGCCGENAAGRNSGFAIDLPHNIGSSLDELDGSHRYMRLARAAIAHLGGLVGKHQIECNWSKPGKYHAAVSPRGSAEVLEPIARELEALKEPYRWLDAGQIATELGSPYYHAAVYTPGCVLMNPAALVRGLADSLPENVTLYESSPVVRFEEASGLQAMTPGGSVRAPRAILCVNGFAGQFGAFPRHMLMFRAHASLTRPLDQAEQRTLGGLGQWGLTPANAFVSVTMRYTQDRRILIRHDIKYAPSARVSEGELERVRARHLRILRQRFPMLPDVTIEHTWTGYIALSRNAAPGFGRISPAIHAAVCCNAVGVTKSTIAGLLAADMAMGEANPLIADMASLGQPARLPPEPFLGLGVRMRNRLDLWRARHEA